MKEKLQGADYCITGEGGIDFQTKFGKAPFGVAQAAKSVDSSMKVIALAGYVGQDIEVLYNEGFDAIFGIVPGAAELETLLAQGKANVARTAESVARLLK
ncbi:Glycerate kinase [compost metagenome]